MKVADSITLKLGVRSEFVGGLTTLEAISSKAATLRLAEMIRAGEHPQEGEQIQCTGELEGTTTVSRSLINAAMEELMR